LRFHDVEHITENSYRKTYVCDFTLYLHTGLTLRDLVPEPNLTRAPGLIRADFCKEYHSVTSMFSVKKPFGQGLIHRGVIRSILAMPD